MDLYGLYGGCMETHLEKLWKISTHSACNKINFSVENYNASISDRVLINKSIFFSASWKNLVDR